MPQPALILTGASGFVGRHLLAELKGDYRIFAIARRSQRECGAPIDPNIAWMQVDLGDREDLGRALREIQSAGGAKFLIHLGAYYDFTGDRHPEYQRTNIGGTSNILDLVRPLRLERLFFASSVAAHRFPRREGPITEATPPDGPHVYAWSKREGERLIRECPKVPSCIVRFGAMFSDWCEYPPLYSFLQTWLGRSWRARALPGKGNAAIPYIHVWDAVRFLRRLLEVHDRLGQAEPVIASAAGSTPIKDLFHLATRHFFGRPQNPLFVPPPVCALGLHATDLMGRVSGHRPFERPWMHSYIDKRMEVENTKTRAALEWSPLARYQIERRFPLMIERLRSEPLEWRARNEAAMRREADRPGLRVYKTLIAVEEEVIAAMARILDSPSGADLLAAFRKLDAAEFRWIVRLLFRLVLTTIQTSNRLLVLNYMEVTCADRFRAGIRPEELRNLLKLLNDTILESLEGRPDFANLGQTIYDQITVPLQLAMDEVREQHDRFQEGGVAPAEAAATSPLEGLSPREALEQTIFSCLVQRK
ncbi:MAG: NAD(P)-dependent oxidoreductase [Candidatus Eisenbacteria bacterium]|nr:NAD(P)-dependent oxidoreductase [Candidatus Eisenbacteria bacterium]